MAANLGAVHHHHHGGQPQHHQGAADFGGMEEGGIEIDAENIQEQLTAEEAAVLYHRILAELQALPGGADGNGVAEDDPRPNAVTPAMAQRAGAILNILAARMARGNLN
jgi:hypothetical protein